MLYVRVSPYLLPHSTWARSCEPPAEGEDLNLAVGTLNVLRYHRLCDVETLASSVLWEFCSCLDTTGMKGSSSLMTMGLCGHGLDDASLPLSERVRKRCQLARSFIGPVPKLGSGLGMENGNREQAENGTAVTGTKNENVTSMDGMESGNLDGGSYMEYCSSVLKQIRARTTGMELTENCIASYAVGQFSWQAGELSKRLHSKNLFSLLGERGATDDVAQSRAVYISLKGMKIIGKVMANHSPKPTHLYSQSEVIITL